MLADAVIQLAVAKGDRHEVGINRFDLFTRNTTTTNCLYQLSQGLIYTESLRLRCRKSIGSIFSPNNKGHKRTTDAIADLDVLRVRPKVIVSRRTC